MSDINTLAEAVVGWGNCTEAWLDTSEDDASAVVGHIDEDGNTYPVAVIDCEQYYAGHDSLKLARFYAAANPAAVLGLVAEIESLRQQLDEAKIVSDNNLKVYQAAAEKLRQQLADMTEAYTKVAERIHMVGGYIDQLATMTAERDAYMRDYGEEQDRKREVAQKLAASESRLHEVSVHCATVEQQLSDSQKREVMLRDTLQRLHDAGSGEDDNEFYAAASVTTKILAATADLDGLILCEKKPYVKAADGYEALYRAWEQK